MIYKNLTVELIQERLSYDGNTGLFTWEPRKDAPQYNARWAGKPALNTLQPKGKSPFGYIDTLHIKARDAAWAIIHGEFRHDLYHWNKDMSDNRILNIRARGYHSSGGFPPDFLQQLHNSGMTVDMRTFEVVYA
jgi:hypothetical protein